MDISPRAAVRKHTRNGAGGRRFDDFCLCRRLRGLLSRQPMVPPVTTCVGFFVFVYFCICVCVFHETVSPASWGARRVWTYICIRMCGDIYFMYVWASPHLYIFLIELGDIKCTTTSPNGSIFRVPGPVGGESTGHRWTPLT